MATVHPSRLALVPQESPTFKTRDGDRDRNRKDSNASYRGSRSRNDGGERRDPDRDSEGRDERSRRHSPDYSAYRRDEPPHVAGPADSSTSVPWRAPENIYPPRGDGRGRGGYGGGLGGGDEYFASRRKERENKEFSIWPPSPKHPSRELSPVRASKQRYSSKRRRSSSVTSSSEDERDKRRREKKKHKDKGKDREDRKDKHKKRHKREKSYDDDSDDDRRHRRRKGHSRRSDESSDDESRSRSRRRDAKEQTKSRHSSRADPPWSHDGGEEDAWVEKKSDAFVAIAEHAGIPRSGAQMMRSTKPDPDSDLDSEVGPQPAPKATNAGKKVDEREYGGALLRGEGSAMAAFLQGGNTEARIPRRGEIGLAPDEIATFEAVGYVMSGSRHRRMNAVRMRKENQVISAEEKRGILKLQRDERERREAILRDEFRELVQEKLKGTGTDAGGTGR